MVEVHFLNTSFVMNHAACALAFYAILGLVVLVSKLLNLFCVFFNVVPHIMIASLNKHSNIIRIDHTKKGDE